MVDITDNAGPGYEYTNQAVYEYAYRSLLVKYDQLKAEFDELVQALPDIRKKYLLRMFEQCDECGGTSEHADNCTAKLIDRLLAEEMAEDQIGQGKA